MVRAVLDGTKTMTRRVIKRPLPHDFDEWSEVARREAVYWKCPYGQPGDRLWVRECFSYLHDYDAHHTFKDPSDPIHHWADGNPDYGDWTKPKPSIHMPRWASRIDLEVTGVRVERVQDISNEDAQAEGCREYGYDHDDWLYHQSGYIVMAGTPREEFQELWDSINAKRGYGWESNPWVWAVDFKIIDNKNGTGK